MGQGPHERPYTIVNALLFFFLDVGWEMGRLSSKNYSLTTLEEKNQREVTLVECHKLYSLVVFLCWLGSKPNHFIYIFFSSVAKATVVFYKS